MIAIGNVDQQSARFLQIRKQHGTALIVALLFLFIVSLISVTNLQTVALEEKMAASSSDRNIALQAAEAALRVGEAIAEAQSNTTPQRNSNFPCLLSPSCPPKPYGKIYEDTNNDCKDDDGDTCPSTAIDNCLNGLCPTPDKDCPPRWQVADFKGWVDATGLNLGALAGNTPQYFVEYLGDNYPCDDSVTCNCGSSDLRCSCKRYRITVRSNPGTGRAKVILQTVYGTE